MAQVDGFNRRSSVLSRRGVITLCLFLGPAADLASAADQPNTAPAELAEVIVTAQKRSENLQQIPISVSALSSTDLQERGISNVRDLDQGVPGLTFEDFNGIVQPFLRGVGTTAAVSSGPESSVAVYIDGVYYSRLTASFLDLANVQRVEVLKGPQGTLFGRNSTGGVINVVTFDPSFDSHGAASISYGNYNSVFGNGYYTNKLTDSVAFDIAVSGQRNDGWGRNSVTGNRFNYEDNGLVRSKLLWKPSDATKFLLTGYWNASAENHNGYPYPGTTSASLSNPSMVYSRDALGYYNTSSNIDGANKFTVWGVTGRLEQDLSFARLVSISAYSRMRENTYGGFVDNQPTPNAENFLAGPTDLFTQEIQLLSKQSGPLNWVLGYYYYNDYAGYTSNPTLTGPLYGPGLTINSHQKVISNAGFGQATYEIVPNLKLTGGLRYTAEHNRADGEFFLDTDPPVFLAKPGQAEFSVDKLTFRVSLDYQFTDDFLAYASFNRGFKSGTFNLLPYTTNVPAKPEQLDAYEIGIKSEWLARRVRVNAAGFDYQIKAPQVQLEFATGTLFSNAGSSRVRGGEFEVDSLITDHLMGRLSYTYLDSIYTNYNDAPATQPDLATGGSIALNSIDASGHQTPLASRHTADAGMDYSAQDPLGTVSLGADFYYNSGYYFEPDNVIHQGSYHLLNAQLRQELSRNLTVRFWGKNLTDTRYAVVGSTVSGGSNFGVQFSPGAPRTYGITLDLTF